MADLNIVPNGVRIVESFIQDTQPLLDAQVEGAAVRIDTATGRFTAASAVEAHSRAYGVLARGGVANEPVTAVRKGVLEGFDLDHLDYDAPVYLSDNPGRLADAPSVNNEKVEVGRVIRANNHPTLGESCKLLFVDL